MDGMIILETNLYYEDKLFFPILFFIILAGCSDDKITPELPQIQTIRMKGFMIKSSFK